MISLILATYRPGGFDVFAQSFRNLPPDADYEVVVVDDYPGRVERGTVPPYLQEKGVKLGWYGKSKPKSYQTKGGLMNAWNTALMHCRGNWTMFISDYSWLPDCWLSQWEWVKGVFETGYLVSGGAILYLAAKPDLTGDVYSWSGPVLPLPKCPWVPWKWESFYWGCSWDYWEKTGGMDERADHSHCWPVSSQISQAAQLGYRLQVTPEICVHMLDHRLWDDKDEPAPDGCGMEGMWKIGGELQSLAEEPQWQAKSPNPYDLTEERRKNGL